MKQTIWEEKELGWDSYGWECQQCEEAYCFECGDAKENSYNYCPNCGAKIVEYIRYEGDRYD